MPDFMNLLASGIKKNAKLVVSAVTALTSAMSKGMTDSVDDMGNELGDAIRGIASDITSSIDSLSSSAEEAGRGIQSGLVNGMTGMQSKFREIWNEIKGTTSESLSAMTENIRNCMTEMSGQIGQLGSDIDSLGGYVSRLGQTIGSDFVTNLGNGISKIGSFVNSLGGIIDKLTSIGDTLPKMIDRIQSFSSSLSDGGLLSKLGDLGSGIQNLIFNSDSGISGLLSNVSSGFSGVLSNIGSGITNLVSNAGFDLSGLFSSVGSGFSGIVSQIGSGISGLVGSVGSGLSGVVSGIGSTLGGIASSAGSAITGLLGSAGSDVIANPNEHIPEKTRKIQEDNVQVLHRDDGSSKNITLIDKKNIHNNCLQVINQYEVKQADGARHDNRYDVTILVNGFPLVHVELKRRGVAIREAFNQINRYQRDSFWAGCGLYEYVQIFVISNGTNTKYYSNSTRYNAIKDAKHGKTKKEKTSNSFEFTSYWADANNRVLTDLIDFTRTFFAKHTILSVLTRYCIFTSEKMLMVMRPYQITATERILNRIEIANNYKKYGSIEGGGYIWHTTGSGKTLTSFKTARLASQLPYIDKVLFVVDRKDLDYQTMKEYDRFKRARQTPTPVPRF